MNRPYDPQSFNKYAFVRSDPVNRVDPDGRTAKIFWCSGYDSEGQYYSDLCGVIVDWGYVGGGGGFGGGGQAPRDRDLLPDAEAIALQALKNPECSGLFGSKPGSSLTGAEVLRSLAGDGVYGRIQFENKGPNWGVAETRPAITMGLLLRGRTSSVVTTINSFSDGKKTGLYWNDNNLLENAETLLHELGHALRVLGFVGGHFAHQDRDTRVAVRDDILIWHYCLGMRR